MSPRCGMQIYIFLMRNQLSAINKMLFLSLHHENTLYHHRNTLFDIGHTWNLSSPTAYNSFFTSYSRSLFQGISPIIRMAAKPKTHRALYPQFSRIQSDSIKSENLIRFTCMDYPSLLHFLFSIHALASNLIFLRSYRS